MIYNVKIKFTKKIIITLIITIILNILMLSTANFAAYDPEETVKSGESSSKIPSFTSPIEDPLNYEPTVKNSSVTSKMVATIVNWIRNIGIIIGVLVLTIIGFKYMLAGGAEEKAQYKETLMPLVIGVVMLMGSITLISSIASLFNKG